MKIVAFEMKYMAGVLHLWNTYLKHDLISEERFIDVVLLDENFSPNLLKVALVDDKVVGFAFGIKRKIPYLERGLEPTRGWINMIAVDENYRRQKIATQLVEALETELKALGTTEITLCAYSPNYFTPGIDKRYPDGIALFEALGYRHTEDCVSMQRDLWDYEMSAYAKEKRIALEKEGIRIIPYNKDYLLKTIDFVLKGFGAGWKRNVMMAMQKHEAEKNILLVVDGNDDILGFCMRKIDGNEGRFGPIGVDESLRNKGIGGVLFEVMMYDMKSKGIPYLYFLWTAGKAQSFYERHGIKVFRTYQLYRKDI